MQIQKDKIEENIYRISLIGRMDLEGTYEIDMKFSALSASEKALIVVNLNEVNFISSIGMRTLVASAKAQALRGGKIVLCSAQPMVRNVLDQSGITQVLQLFEDEVSAINELRGL